MSGSQVTAATRADLITVELFEADLALLLARAELTAWEDSTLFPGSSAVHGVRLHTDVRGEVPVLVATSTNLYSIGQGHVPVDEVGPRPVSVFVSLPEVRRVTAACRAASGTVRLQIEAGEMTVQRVTGRKPETLTVPVAMPDDARLPERVDKLLAAPACEPVAGLCGIAGRDARRLGQIADMCGDYLAVSYYGPDLPMRVQIGSEYRAVVQPAPVANYPKFMAPAFMDSHC